MVKTQNQISMKYFKGRFYSLANLPKLKKEVKVIQEAFDCDLT